jgi:Phage integrase, N-terminal SAM-like domain
MTKPSTPLRQRMIEDMAIRNMSPLTQAAYVRAVTNFALYCGVSPDKLTFEDVRKYQVHLVSRGLKGASIIRDKRRRELQTGDGRIPKPLQWERRQEGREAGRNTGACSDAHKGHFGTEGTPWSTEATNELVAEFARSVANQSEAVARGDATSGNGFAKRYIAAFEKLRARGDAGRDALSALLSNPRADVIRRVSAVCLGYLFPNPDVILTTDALGLTVRVKYLDDA